MRIIDIFLFVLSFFVVCKVNAGCCGREDLEEVQLYITQLKNYYRSINVDNIEKVQLQLENRKDGDKSLLHEYVNGKKIENFYFIRPITKNSGQNCEFLNDIVLFKKEDAGVDEDNEKTNEYCLILKKSFNETKNEECNHGEKCVIFNMKSFFIERRGKNNNVHTREYDLSDGCEEIFSNIKKKVGKNCVFFVDDCNISDVNDKIKNFEKNDLKNFDDEKRSTLIKLYVPKSLLNKNS